MHLTISQGNRCEIMSSDHEIRNREEVWNRYKSLHILTCSYLYPFLHFVSSFFSQSLELMIVRLCALMPVMLLGWCSGSALDGKSRNSAIVPTRQQFHFSCSDKMLCIIHPPLLCLAIGVYLLWFACTGSLGWRARWPRVGWPRVGWPSEFVWHCTNICWALLKRLDFSIIWTYTQTYTSQSLDGVDICALARTGYPWRDWCWWCRYCEGAWLDEFVN